MNLQKMAKTSRNLSAADLLLWDLNMKTEHISVRSQINVNATICFMAVLGGMLTAAPAAETLITPTGVTASSEFDGGGIDQRDASQLTDNSGLTSSDLSGTHDTDVRTTMWMSNGTLKTPNDTDPDLLFDLGEVYDLTTIHIWAYNETGSYASNPALPSRGAKDVDVLGSTDGISYALISSISLNMAGGVTGEPVQNFSVFQSNVRYIRFDIASNHNNATFPTDTNGGTYSGGSEGYGFTGMSEVKFTVHPIGEVLSSPLLSIDAAAEGQLTLSILGLKPARYYNLLSGTVLPGSFPNFVSSEMQGQINRDVVIDLPAADQTFYVVKDSQFPVEAPEVLGLEWPDATPAGSPIPVSTDYQKLFFTGRYANYTLADTWYPSWGADDRLYSPFTDGDVMDANGDPVSSWSYRTSPTVGHAIVTGSDPLELEVINPGIIDGSATPYIGRYPCGSLHYNGVWYIGSYGLNNAAYGGNWPIMGPCAGFHTSTDNGVNWTVSPRSCALDNALFPEPTVMDGPVKFGAPHFVDFGKNMEHSPDGKAYLVGHGSTEFDGDDRNFNLSWITGDSIYLCRVTPSVANINDANQYEYFAGHDTGTGDPIWSSDFADTEPIVEWDNNCGCVTITYNAPLQRYLMCVTDGGNTVGPMNTYILESTSMTGPWKKVTYMENFGVQAYFVNIPTKFISNDGKTFWLCYSANYAPAYRDNPEYSNPKGSEYSMSMHEVMLLAPGEEPPPAPETHLTATNNLALQASVEVSSVYSGYTAAAANDGIVDGWPGDTAAEWTSNSEGSGAWIKLTWDTPQTISAVQLFDRPNQYDQVIVGNLEFSDGTSIALTDSLEDDASSGQMFEFAPKTVSWVKFTVNAVKTSTQNIGLSEFAVFAERLE